MLNKFYKISGVIVASALPFISYAQTPLGKTRGLFTSAKSIVVDLLIPLAFVLALLFFFWGVAKYIWSVGGDGKEEGKKVMIWGIVALFVMASVWGLVAFLQDELIGGAGSTTVPVPTIGGSSSSGGGGDEFGG